MRRLSSAVIENAFFKNASPVEILQYLDFLVAEVAATEEINSFSDSILDKDSAQTLLDRHDRLIDLAHARVAEEWVMEQLLVRNDVDENLTLLKDSLILTVALGSVGVAKESKCGWLDSRMANIIKFGAQKQIAVLMKNPHLSPALILAALKKMEQFSAIDQKQHISILWSLLDNPRVKKAPKEKEFLPHDDPWRQDWDAIHINDACWSLLFSLEVSDENDHAAQLLSYYIDGFHDVGFWPDVRQALGVTEFSTEASDQADQAFLEYVFQKWNKTSDEELYLEIKGNAMRKLGKFRLRKLEGFIRGWGDENLVGWFDSVFEE